MVKQMGIVGTGRMAQALGSLLRASGIAVSAIAGRRLEAAALAAAFIGAGEIVAMTELSKHALEILIAVSDDAIAGVAHSLAACDIAPRTVLHTSGSAGPEALAELRVRGVSVGVLHPLQTVPTPESGVKALPGSTFGCAGDPEAVALALEVVSMIGGKPLLVPAENWQLYHAAAVMASNYEVTLIDAALELMQHAGIGRAVALEALASLVLATTENVLACGPEAALTGPIRRGDAGTVQRHMLALQPVRAATRNLYAAAGIRTLAVGSCSGLAPNTVRRIEDTLRT